MELQRACWRRYASKPGVKESRREMNRDRYHQLKALGLCVKCKQPAREGKTMCGNHPKKRRAKA